MPTILPPLVVRSCAVLALALAAFSQTPLARASQTVRYSQQVQPILAKHCFACHGPETSEGTLALDSAEGALGEKDSGLHAIVPGDSAASELMARITTSDDSMRMPPHGKPLSEAEIETLRRWIDQGAEWEPHWAFQEVRAVEPPEVKQHEWVTNAVDRFVLARLEAAGLQPAPPADRRTLARRLYYDLTGLPPTPAELAEFLDDPRQDAYERLVDRLLQSPHYGERWGRHWLDVVRFAESNSFERDAAKPNAWKYRDYIIRSLNEDKPYDQLIREQLAGDQLPEVTTETMTATGYYRLGLWDDEPADPVQALADEMDDIVSTTGQAFLGLTVGCARCHDHKIDPIPQRDYFGLVAMMADVTTYGIRSDQTSNNQWENSGPEDRAERRQLRRELRRATREMVRIEQEAIRRMPGPLQRKTETEERASVLAEHLDRYLEDSERERYAEWKAEQLWLQQRMDDLGPAETILGLARTHTNPPPVRIHERGNPHVLGEEVSPHIPELFKSPSLEFDMAGSSTSRRRALAEWIASSENFLTSRVMANRVWQHHFGRGIVRTPNNFGQLGTPPTHPELLDYLATYLVESGWRLKPLHKLIVTSSAYRMSSEANPAALAKDPANDLFWRFDLRRLSAEEVRDSVLLVSGQLNRKIYGPSIYPKLSDEVLTTQSMPGEGWGESSPEEQARRSVYIFVKRSLQVPLLAAFDFPDPDTSCEARFNTTQPAQAFSLLHSEFMHRQAAELALRVEREAGEGRGKQVAAAVHRVLGRAATDQEIVEGVALIDLLTERHEVSPQEGLRYYCLALMNFNEFLYVD